MFGGGGGGLNPRKMQQMMEQMGVDFDEIDATEVVMRLSDGSELYFEDPDVNRIVAQGQETYQVVGEPAERESTGDESGGEPEEADADDGTAIPDSDVEIVAQRTGASEREARETLAETDGDLAAAVERLE
ncbi:MAG: nascent polypeptide-associated complex protein [Halobacteriales archaeon]